MTDDYSPQPHSVAVRASVPESFRVEGVFANGAPNDIAWDLINQRDHCRSVSARGQTWPRQGRVSGSGRLAAHYAH